MTKQQIDLLAVLQRLTREREEQEARAEAEMKRQRQVRSGNQS